jgi:hypothetical protein
MQPRNKSLSREELLQSWLQQKTTKDGASAKENSGAAVSSSAIKKVLHSGSTNIANAGLSEISASSINTTNSTGKRTRDATEAPHHPAASSSSSSGSSSSTTNGSSSSSGAINMRRKSTLVTSIPSSVPSYARPLKSSAVAAAAGAGMDATTKSRAVAKNAELPPGSLLPQSEQTSPAGFSDSTATSQSSFGGVESHLGQTASAAPSSAAAPSLLLVAAAQKLLQEQQRADSLLKAKLQADSEIASLRACVQEKEQQLQLQDKALAAAGVSAPQHSSQQSGVAVSPASSSANLPVKQQYIPEVEQRLWEEQQRSLR